MNALNFKDYKFLVVGAGLFGSVVAERIASEKGDRVLVIERRDHIGGNCSSFIDPTTGIECHKFGTHVFHTDNMDTWEYIRRFMALNNYRHRVLAKYKNAVYHMPINLSTINRFYGTDLDPAAAGEFMANEISKAGISRPQNLEEKAISLVGRPLYEAFIHGYTVKQWGTDPRNLPADIITRLPFRLNYNSEYYDDPIQGVPKEGYEAVFRSLLSHKNITVRLNTDYFDIKKDLPAHLIIIYTGPIDRFLDYKYGALGWRTVDLDVKTIEKEDFQGTAVMNYTEKSVPYTRIHEFRHLHPEKFPTAGATVICREYPKPAYPGDEPYYPVNDANDKKILEKYRSESPKNVHIGGRLGSYRYLDMDDTITEALHFFETSLKSV
ncbi:MAG: UDP-galactopyranose mutase [Spirochaetes bacterium]|nr:UDP-galactopyranose mutase [Spirochaetota bacterium]